MIMFLELGKIVDLSLCFLLTEYMRTWGSGGMSPHTLDLGTKCACP